MNFTPRDTPLVLTDPQNEFLSADGETYLVGDSVEGNGTVEHIESLLKAPKDHGRRRAHDRRGRARNPRRRADRSHRVSLSPVSPTSAIRPDVVRLTRRRT